VVNTIDAMVDMVEPIGAETYFYLQTGAHTLISRSSAQVDHKQAGHRLRFEINADQAHLFDPDNGKRIV
jgi:multiple sugar transport system ATP-binding protein